MERDPFAIGGEQADATLFAAEENLKIARGAFEGRPDDESDEDAEPFLDAIDSQVRIIMETPPASLPGAAVKLRLLADPEIGLEIGHGEEDAQVIRQVLALIEALPGQPREARRMADIIPFTGDGQPVVRIPAIMSAVADGLGQPRLMPIEDDAMQPELRHGDLVVVVPIDHFRCDGLYVLDVSGTAAVYRCSSNFRGGIEARRDNPLYSDWTFPTGAEFDAHVLGYVVATVKVIDRPAFQAAVRAEP
jgi:hypothetical protein